MKKFMNYQYDTNNPEERQNLIKRNLDSQKIRKKIQVK